MNYCSINECDNKLHATGYCRNHYYLFRKYGDPRTRVRAEMGSVKGDPLYKILMHIHARCLDKNNKQYNSYGGRGILLCDRWNRSILGYKAFENFKKDVGKRPAGYMKSGKPLYTLDRVDNNKGYSPDNVRWATYNQQNTNTRKNNIVPGVVYDKARGKWKARLQIRGESVLNKRFDTVDQAITARKEAERLYL